MKINHKVQQFRLARANDLDILARLFEYNDLDSGPIRKAISQLRDYDNILGFGEQVNYDYWGYEIKNLTIPFNEKPKVIHPKDAEHLELRLNCLVIADFNSYGKMVDPLVHLEFDVIIEGMSEEIGDLIYTGFHIDRHLEGENEPDEVHPIYHVHFGGQGLSHEGTKYGQSLFLGAPRIMYYPIDLILGIDFIISNYFPKLKKSFHASHDFISVIKEQQVIFWKPFFHCLASQWTGYNHADNIWKAKTIWPQLL